MAENEGVAAPAATKTGSFIQKHKTPLIIGGVILFFVIAYYMFSNYSGGSSNAGTTGSTIGNPTDLAGPSGPAGPPGPRGPRGLRGKRGRPGKPTRKHEHVPPPVAKPASAAVLTANTATYHTVQPGETFSSIGVRHGMDASNHYAMNRNVYGSQNTPLPGQRVRVR